VLSVTFDAGDAGLTFMVLWVLGVLTAFMTAFYMFRMWFMVFKGQPREGSKHAIEHGHTHEAPIAMLAPLVILAALPSGQASPSS